jgi:hypothetical protein
VFNLLISGNGREWETTGPMSMLTGRFKEHSGDEAAEITLKEPETLHVLEHVPAFLMYEWGVDGPAAEVVRYGFLENIKAARRSIQFNLRCNAHCRRDLVDEFASLLGLGDWERHRTHWAIKDGDPPREMLRRMIQGPYRKHRYEVVLSYAGEDQAYVEEVAKFLKSRGVELFYAPFKEADLWGTDLSEELDIVYRMEGRYCVMFLSKKYAEKAWPTHERRSAMSRAVQQQTRYILPCRFDDTEVPGLPPSAHYVDLKTKSPIQLGKLIMEVLGKNSSSRIGKTDDL